MQREDTEVIGRSFPEAGTTLRKVKKGEELGWRGSHLVVHAAVPHAGISADSRGRCK